MLICETGLRWFVVETLADGGGERVWFDGSVWDGERAAEAVMFEQLHGLMASGVADANARVLMAVRTTADVRGGSLDAVCDWSHRDVPHDAPAWCARSRSTVAVRWIKLTAEMHDQLAETSELGPTRLALLASWL